MSPWASIQIRPTGLCVALLAHSAAAATEPAARLWSPPSTSGNPPLSNDISAHLVDLLADPRDVQNVFLPIVVLVLGLRNRGRQVAVVDDRVTQSREALAKAGDTKRRRAHVHAPAPAAEIERHANQMDGLHKLQN